MLKQLKYLRKIDWLYLLISCVFIFGDVWCELTIPDYMQKITNLITIEPTMFCFAIL